MRSARKQTDDSPRLQKRAKERHKLAHAAECALLESRTLFSAQLVGLGTGLIGNYYSDANYSNLAGTRVDPVINFKWGATAPIAGLGTNNYSVQWSGQLQPQYSETYTFSVIGGGPVTLSINGNQIINSSNASSGATGTIALTAGQLYDVQLGESETAGTGNVADFAWSSPSTPQQDVPTTQLYPSSGWVTANWIDADVGSPPTAGSATSVGSLYTVQGSGTGLGGSSDQFNYLYKTLDDNGSIIAQVDSSQVGAAAGIEIRASASATSSFAALTLTPGGTASLVSRSTSGSAVTTVASLPGLGSKYWLKLVRDGTFFTSYASPDGSTWTLVGTTVVTLPTSALFGLMSSSGSSQNAPAAFSNVSVTPTIALGGNLASVNDASTDDTFVDMTKQARAFEDPTFSYTVPTDANGWPTTDFGVIFQSGYLDTAHIYNGVYNLSFTGQATIGTWVSPATVSNQQYNAATNTTTAQVTLNASDSDSGWYFGLTFTNTIGTGGGGGVTNLKMIQPGYAANTTQIFTNAFLSQLTPYSTLRFMGFTGTNNSTEVNWSDRTLPTAAEQSSDNGVAWEYAIDLANITGKDLWINIPFGATDDYVTQLAQLIKANLNPDRVVYVEYSNELWNFAFEQFSQNLAAAKAAVAAGTTLNNDGETNIFYIADRRVGLELHNISVDFAAVWGQAAINTRIRPVLAGQMSDPVTISEPLQWLSANYGNPSNYIYAIAGAPYFNLNGADTDPGLTSAQVLTALAGSITQVETEYSQNLAIAQQYGLRLYAYEAGDDTTGPNDIAAKAAASLDPEMETLVIQYLDTWYASGGDLLMWFIAGPSNWATQYGTFGVTNALDNFTSPKLLGIESVLAGAKPELDAGSIVSSTIDARDFVGSSQPYADPYLEYLHQGNSVTYLVQAPVAGVYALSLVESTTGTTEQVQFTVNGVAGQTVTLADTGGTTTWGTTLAGNVTLVAGVNAIEMTNVNEVHDFNMQSLTLTAPAPAPTTPTALSASSVTPTTIPLTWIALPNATDYIIEQSPVATFSIIATYDTQSTQIAYTVHSLYPSTGYYFRVRAVVNGVKTAPSNVINVSTASNSVISTLYAYDGFGPTSGALQGDTSGTGWNSSGWQVQNGSTAVPGYEIDSTPLTYGNLTTTAGSASGGYQYLSAGRSFDTANSLSSIVNYSTGLLGQPGTSIWFSVLIQRNFPVGSNTYFTLNSNGVPWYSNNGVLSFGLVDSGASAGYWGLSAGGKIVDSVQSATIGQPTLLVVELSFGSTASTASLFVNPTGLGGGGPSTPDAQVTTSNLQFNAIAYYGGDSAGTSSFNDLRMGNNFAAVTPTSAASGGTGTGTGTGTSTTPTTPTGLSVTGTTAGTATVSWPLINNAIGYTVEASTSSNMSSPIFGSASATTNSFTFTQLQPGTTYYFALSQTTSTGTSAFSTAISSTTLPATPTGLAVTGATTNSATVSWPLMTGATGYTIEASTSSNMSSPITGTASATTSSYTFSTLQAGVTYYFAFSQTTAAGTSAFSTAISASTIPATPTGLTVTGTTANSATVSWPLMTGATGYTVEASTSSNLSSPITVATSATTSSFTFTALQAGVTYYFALSQTTANGTSAFSTPISASTLPATPTGLTVTGTTSTTASVSWPLITGATGYSVEASTSSTLSSPITGTASAATNAYSFTQLQAGTKYYFALSQTTAAGTSAFSTAISASTAPATPTGLTVTGTTSSTATVTWPLITGATGYTVEASTSSSIASPITGTASATTSSYTFSQLQPGTTYYFALSQTGATGTSSFSTPISSSTTSGVATPTGLVVTGTTISSATVTWPLITGAIGYTVELSTSSSLTSPTIGTASATTNSYTFNQLLAGKKYYVAFSQTTAAGTSGFSTPIAACTIPATPTGLAVTSTTATTALVLWPLITGATGYTVEASTSSTMTSPITGTASASGTSYTFTLLQPGTKYYFALSQTTAYNTSAFSAPITASTLPATPTGLAVTGTTTTTATVSWPLITGATGYTVEASTSSGLTSPITGTASATGTSYTFTNLQAGTTYYFALSQTAAAGTSAFGTAITANTIPATPAGLAVTGTTTTTATVTWPLITGATGYTVEASTSSSLTSPITGTASATGTSYTFTLLQPGTKYYFALSQTTAVGTSAFSTAITANTIPATPTGLSVTGTTTTTATVSWPLITGATGYTVEASTSSSLTSPITGTASATGTSYTFTQLQAGTTYYFALSQTTAVGTSAFSTAITANTIPATPTGLTVTGTTTTSATVSWPLITGATGYTVEASTSSSLTSPITGTASATGTSYTFTQLLSGTTYYFALSQTTALGTSAFSTPISASTTAVATGSLLASDGFNSTSGALQGDTSGTGWSGGWLVQNGSTTVPGYEIDPTVLTDGNLVTDSGSASGGYQYLTAGRTFDTTGALASVVNSATGLIGQPGTTLWLSVLVQRNAAIGSNTYISLHSNSVAWNNANAALSFGLVDSGANAGLWGLTAGGKTVDSTQSAVIGQPTLLVISLTFGASTSTASLFVNPTAWGGSAPTAPNAVITTSSLQFKALAYYAGDRPGTSSIDDLRLGTSYSAVTPTVSTSSTLSAPTGLAVTGTTTSTATISWPLITGATGYTVEASTSSTFTSPLIASVSATTSSFTFTQLQAGTTYYFRISQTAGTSSSPYGVAVSASTTAAAVVNTLIASDGFGSTSGALQGDTSGSGWNGAWQVQNGATTGYQDNPTGLSYSNLATSGGSANAGGGYLTAGRSLDANGAFSAYQDASTGLIGKPGTTLWLSVLVQRNVGGTGNTYFSLNTTNVAWYSGSPALSFGLLNASTGLWSISAGGTTVNTTKAIAVGQTALLVVELSFGTSSTTASIFVNPTSLGGSAPTAPDAVVTTTNFEFDNLAFYGGDSTGASTIDELRFGTSYASVTPTSS